MTCSHPLPGPEENVGNKVRLRQEQSGFFIINEFQIFFGIESDCPGADVVISQLPYKRA